LVGKARQAKAKKTKMIRELVKKIVFLWYIIVLGTIHLVKFIYVA